jgi:hypothetical protein
VEVPETNASLLDKEKCSGFDILETVPDDHPFKSDTPVRTSPDWLSRLRKEHRILQTSLPGISTIAIRFILHSRWNFGPNVRISTRSHASLNPWPEKHTLRKRPIPLRLFPRRKLSSGTPRSLLPFLDPERNNRPRQPQSLRVLTPPT